MVIKKIVRKVAIVIIAISFVALVGVTTISIIESSNKINKFDTLKVGDTIKGEVDQWYFSKYTLPGSRNITFVVEKEGYGTIGYFKSGSSSLGLLYYIKHYECLGNEDVLDLEVTKVEGYSNTKTIGLKYNYEHEVSKSVEIQDGTINYNSLPLFYNSDDFEKRNDFYVSPKDMVSPAFILMSSVKSGIFDIYEFRHETIGDLIGYVAVPVDDPVVDMALQSVE